MYLLLALVMLSLRPSQAVADPVADPVADKPNIIFIMADDLGWNDVSYHGSEIRTPNIDNLARTGVELNNYYTAPNCGPSRAQFLTGKHVTSLGLQHKNLAPCRPSGVPLSEKTIADDLATLGYKNHLIGKWHAGFFKEGYLPTNRGFHTFRGMLLGQSNHYTHQRRFGGRKSVDFYNNTTPMLDLDGEYSTDIYTERALEVIDEHAESGQPMFMFLSHQAPHTPLQAPLKYNWQYSHIPLRKRRLYAAMVTAMDDAIGQVVEKLKTSGLYNNSVIVFSTDNGGQALSSGASNWPYRGNKATYYEGGLKSVGLVAGPLVQRGAVSNDLFHITDWKPTLVTLAGGSGSNSDGHNQWTALSTGKPDATSAREDIIFNIDPLSIATGSSESIIFDTRKLAAIRSGKWKLMTGVVGFNGIVPHPVRDISSYANTRNIKIREASVRLFDLSIDPTESNNVASANPSVVNSLLAKLKQHEESSKPVFYPRQSSLCRPKIYKNKYIVAPYA